MKIWNDSQCHSDTQGQSVFALPFTTGNNSYGWTVTGSHTAPGRWQTTFYILDLSPEHLRAYVPCWGGHFRFFIWKLLLAKSRVSGAWSPRPWKRTFPWSNQCRSLKWVGGKGPGSRNLWLSCEGDISQEKDMVGQPAGNYSQREGD